MTSLTQEDLVRVLVEVHRHFLAHVADKPAPTPEHALLREMSRDFVAHPTAEGARRLIDFTDAMNAWRVQA